MRPRRPTKSRIPEVNLVPMMDVLMTVLIFFVIISMGLTGVKINGVTLPKSVEGAEQTVTEKESEPFTLGLTSDKALVIDGEPTSLSAITPAVKAYFKENPDGTLLLKADRALPYDDIAVLLNELRAIGGRRVSLAVE